MTPDGILLLAKFMARGRLVDDPQLQQLMFLDDLHNEIYEKHRIKAGFEKALEMANIRVINAVLLREYES